MDDISVSHAFRSMSTVSIIHGIILVIIAMLIFTNAKEAYVMVTTLLGIYLLVKGAIDFFVNFHGSRPDRGAMLFSSIVSIIAGMIVVVNPVFLTVLFGTLIIYVIGFAFIVSGVLSFRTSASMAIINILIGFVMLFFTESVAIGMIWFIALLILLGGILSIILGAHASNIAREIDM